MAADYWTRKQWHEEMQARQLTEALRPSIFGKMAALEKIRRQPFYGDDSWRFGNVIRWQVPNA